MPANDTPSPWRAFWEIIFDAARSLDVLEARRKAEQDTPTEPEPDHK